jgi:hypothetical protein
MSDESSKIAKALSGNRLPWGFTQQGDPDWTVARCCRVAYREPWCRFLRSLQHYQWGLKRDVICRRTWTRDSNMSVAPSVRR